MDWIEHIFGVSPDGGNGMLEAVYYGAAALAVTIFAFRRRIRSWIAARQRRDR